MVLHGFSYPPADWAGVDNPWDGVHPDVAELRRIVCEVFRISDSDRGPAISVGDHERAIYARVYSFSLPGDRSVIARLVAPIKPLFKTEGEVAAIDFVRSKCRNNFFIVQGPEFYSFKQVVPFSLFQKYLHTVPKRTQWG